MDTIQGKMDYYTDICLYLRDHSPSVPQVFIYSSGDKLLRAKYMQDYISQIKKRNVPVVSETDFGEDVKHVSSFYVKNEQYKALLAPFVLDQSHPKSV